MAVQDAFEITADDRDLILRAVATEVDHGLAASDPDEYERQVAGVVDTIINRTASGRFGASVEEVLNAPSQFSAINGPRGRGYTVYGAVRDVPNSRIPSGLGNVVNGWINSRIAGQPSSVGGGLHYANPAFSDANNLAWIEALDGPRFGKGQSTHYHGTTAGYRPFEAQITGDFYNGQGIKLPPGEIPTVMSLWDTTPVIGKRDVLATTPSGIEQRYKFTNTATGDLYPNQDLPAPAMRQGMIDVLKQGPRQQVLLPELPPSTLDRPNIPQSPIERTQLPAATAPKGLLDTLETTVPQSGIERGTPRNTPQGSAPRGLLGMLGSNAGDDLALNSTSTLGGYGPDLMDAAYDERTGAMVRVEPVNTYGMATFSTPAPSPQITMRDISPEREMELLYRGGGPTRPQPAAPRMDPVEQGAGGFGNLATLLGTNTPQQPANPPSGVFQTTTPALAGSVLMPSNYRPQVNIPAMPTQDDTGGSPDWDDFTSTFRPPAPKPDLIPLGDVMSPQPPNASPNSPIAANPPARPISPTPPSPAAPQAPTYRTVMQPTQVENPEFTAWKAANLGASTKPIPLGDVMNPRSRDSVASAAAGANFVATQMPAQWITVQKPVQVAVTPPRPIAAPPVIAPPVAAPMPMPIAAPAQPQAPRGLLDMLGNAMPMGGLLGSLFKPQERRAPIGAVLGTAANGGTLTQGYGGLLNSISQNSDWWQDATGQSGAGDIGRGPAIGSVTAPHIANAAHDARIRR